MVGQNLSHYNNFVVLEALNRKACKDCFKEVLNKNKTLAQASSLFTI